MIKQGFSGKYQLPQNLPYRLDSPVMWKAKFATTHWGPLCTARIIASSLGHWPAMQVFPGRDPRNSLWTTCVLVCLQNLQNLNNLGIIIVVYSYRVWNINTGSKNIRLSQSLQEFIHSCLICFQIIFINLYVTDPAAERIRITDWFHKLKVTDLNISEKTNNSPFFVNNKSIKEHHT